MTSKKKLYSSAIIKEPEDDFVLNEEGSATCLVQNQMNCQQVAVPEQAYTLYIGLEIAVDCHIQGNYSIDVAQKWLTLPGMNGKTHTFPVQTILPKVQMTRKVPPKHLPRDVEVDRLRRRYAKVDFYAKLLDAGITKDVMLPTEEQYQLLSEYAFKHYLPLSFFDDSESEHSPEAWLNLGHVDGEIYPLPAQAYTPYAQSLFKYSWQYVSVSDYNKQTGLWTVMVLMDENIYEIPKVQIRFLAESPTKFIQTILKAKVLRDNAECLLSMETIIDCRTLESLNRGETFTIKGIELMLNELEPNCDPDFFNKLRRELFLVFEHLMACYEFDKYVNFMPKEFPDFDTQLLRESLPRAFRSEETQLEIEFLKSLKLNLKETRHSVLMTFIFYIQAGIEAMLIVAVECQYIETLMIFICNFAKALPLSEFLQAQQQQSNHVAAYLKNTWPLKLSSGITLVLRASGRGWLDISLDNWSVYQMCKISKFILQVKFRMQESMQVLLEKSIEKFARMLLEPCKQLLTLTKTFVWTSNFIVTQFPYPKPIFSLIIGVSEQAKVVYSTPPEEFKPAILEIFKKALEKTNGVRCIDAETMLNLRFAPNLYILTVELIEDLYVYYDIKLDESYGQAEIPLIAYAKLYRRFIAFYMLNINDYMDEYKAADKSSMQVKKDILKHKAQKDELREILPASITIGPFLILVDPLKQFLIKKHTEVVRRLFEYYINRMYDSNSDILEKCSDIYRRVHDRPISIEHLLETRDFALTVPDIVEELRADIQIMWLEYELLDLFFYNLSDMQFGMKWEAYGWPHKILQRLLPLREEQKIDIEDFKRIHLSECIGFDERLESLNEEVQGFSLYFDVEKVQETSVEIKKTFKVIQELQKTSEVLQFRQHLFELEPLSMEFLDSIINAFSPYNQLWSNCAEVIKLEDATMGNPIANIELDAVWESMADIYNKLKQCCDIFVEKPEVRNVAEIFIKRLDRFLPVYYGIKWLKNEYWLFQHWQELAQRSGIDLKYTAAINFQYLIKKGIMEHLTLVRDISEKAENEADEIKRAAEEEERRQQDALQAMILRKAQRKCRRDIL